MLRCKLWAILGHWYNASIEYFVLHITFLTKECVLFALFYGHYWWKIFFLLIYSQFCCNIRKTFLNWWKRNRNWKNFLWRKYLRLVIQFKAVILIPYFCVINCAVELILVVKHSLMLSPSTELFISWTFLSLIEPYKDVGRTRPLELQIRPYGDVLLTPAGDAIKMPAVGRPLALHVGY